MRSTARPGAIPVISIPRSCATLSSAYIVSAHRRASSTGSLTVPSVMSVRALGPRHGEGHGGLAGSHRWPRYGRNRMEEDSMLYGKEHVERYQETDGPEGHDWQGRLPLLLTPKGRRSGKE